MNAVNATAEALQATLEQMEAVEEMRRTLRDIREGEPGCSHWGPEPDSDTRYDG
jgi:hypothetical protein